MKDLLQTIRTVYANPLSDDYVHWPVFRVLYVGFFVALGVAVMNLSWYWFEPEPDIKGTQMEFSGSFIEYHQRLIQNRWQDRLSIETSDGPRTLLMPERRITPELPALRDELKKLDSSDYVDVRVINAYDGQWPMRIAVNGKVIYQKSVANFERRETRKQGPRKTVMLVAAPLAFMLMLVLLFIPWVMRASIAEDIAKRSEARNG